jgi:hypothetical protein
MKCVLFSLLALLAAGSALAGVRALFDTSRPPHAVLGMFGLDEVRWRGGLLGGRFEVCRETMGPDLWTIFRDDQESHAW